MALDYWFRENEEYNFSIFFLPLNLKQYLFWTNEKKYVIKKLGKAHINSSNCIISSNVYSNFCKFCFLFFFFFVVQRWTFFCVC